MSTGRRQFVQRAGVIGLGLVAGCGLPFAAPGPVSRVHRIGYLAGGPPTAMGAAFREGLREFGYVEGENVIIDQRNARGNDQLAEPAADLVRLQPDVILVASPTVARAVLAVGTTPPIVSAGAGDLVTSGLAASQGRPGGNVTGLSTPDLAGKQLQLLQEVVPKLSRVAVVFDTTLSDFRREPYEAAAGTLGLQVQFLGANIRDDLNPMFETAAGAPLDGLLLAQGSAVSGNQDRIAQLALRHRLPSLWVQSEAVERGGLMAYGPNRAALYRRAAYYVDRILKGTKPTELPIEHPREFDFVINLQTAQALGLTIPQHVLLQATDLIQ